MHMYIRAKSRYAHKNRAIYDWYIAIFIHMQQAIRTTSNKRNMSAFYTTYPLVKSWNSSYIYHFIISICTCTIHPSALHNSTHAQLITNLWSIQAVTYIGSVTETPQWSVPSDPDHPRLCEHPSMVPQIVPYKLRFKRIQSSFHFSPYIYIECFRTRIQNPIRLYRVYILPVICNNWKYVLKAVFR